MDVAAFHQLLDLVCADLTKESTESPFTKALVFENRVREIVQTVSNRLDSGSIVPPTNSALSKALPLCLKVDMHPPAQGFPDIVLGDVGIEVKFTEADTWRCIANSVLETNKVRSVKHICIVYGKMGGVPEVRYDV